MAGSLNRVQLIGNLGKDPEIKSFANGGKIANFSIATKEEWKDRTSGEKKERTEWHNISISGDGLVSVVERFLKKGSKVFLEGSLQTRKWQDRDGNDRYTTEVKIAGFGGQLIMLDGKSGGGSGASGGGYGGTGGGNTSGGGWDNGSSGGGRGGDFNGGAGRAGSFGGGGAFDDLDDEVPF